MTATVRGLCDVLTAQLGIPNVRSYAARLVRAGALPVGRAGVDDEGATSLFLAVVAAPRPDDWRPVQERLHFSELVSVTRITRTGDIETREREPAR